MLSSLMAFFHFSPLSSSDTPTTVKFLFLYLLYACNTFGFSARQGPHQLAQKSTNTYFPLKSANLTGRPSVLFCVKSSMGVPLMLRCNTVNLSAICLPVVVCCADRSSLS